MLNLGRHQFPIVRSFDLLAMFKFSSGYILFVLIESFIGLKNPMLKFLNERVPFTIGDLIT